MASWRRLRGALLRAVFHRASAAAAGTIGVALAAVAWIGEFAWESWLTDGAALVVGATGAAFLLAALSGRRGDWIEEKKK
jgi:hypothetical protein